MDAKPKDKADLVKALQDKRDALKKESADIRTSAGTVGRDLTASEMAVIAENDASVSTAEADIAALEKPAAQSYADRIKVLQERRADLVEESRAIGRTGHTRALSDEERRTVQGNDTAVAQIDHEIGLIQREAIDNLPPKERASALQEEADDLAKADIDAGTHVNVASISRLDIQIADAKAEAQQGAKL